MFVVNSQWVVIINVCVEVKFLCKNSCYVTNIPFFLVSVMKLCLQCQRSREVKLGQKCHESSIIFMVQIKPQRQWRNSANGYRRRIEQLDGRRWLVTKTDFIVESCHILSPITVQTLEERAPEEVYLATHLIFFLY